MCIQSNSLIFISNSNRGHDISCLKFGDSDVGDFMMVTGLRCWWQNHYVGDLFRYVGDFLNALNRSSTSQTCHQHIWSPTSVTRIDVTYRIGPYHLKIFYGVEDLPDINNVPIEIINSG